MDDHQVFFDVVKDKLNTEINEGWVLFGLIQFKLNNNNKKKNEPT